MKELKDLFKNKKFVIGICLGLVIVSLLIILLLSTNNKSDNDNTNTTTTKPTTSSTTTTTNVVENDSELENENIDNKNSNTTNSTTKKTTTKKAQSNTNNKTTQKTNTTQTTSKSNTTQSNDNNSYPFDSYVAKFYVNNVEYASYNLTPGKTIPTPTNPKGTNGMCFDGWKLWGTNNAYNFNNKVDKDKSTYSFDAMFSKCEDTEAPTGYATITIKDNNGTTLKTYSHSSDYVSSGVEHIYNYSVDFYDLQFNISGGKDDIGVTGYDTYTLTNGQWLVVSNSKSLKVSTYLNKERACISGFRIYLKDSAGNTSKSYTTMRFCESE